MRLTYRDSTVPHINTKGELWEAYSDCDYNEVINKLAAYEDAEEQGRLVILPCKVGDKFYRAIKETYGRPDRINEYVCIGFYYVNFDEQGLQIRAYETSDGISYGLKIDVLVSASRFGKDIFLTREEAEAALKGEQDK